MRQGVGGGKRVNQVAEKRTKERKARGAATVLAPHRLCGELKKSRVKAVTVALSHPPPTQTRKISLAYEKPVHASSRFSFVLEASLSSRV